MERNGKLTIPIVLGVISLLALSVSVSPSLNLVVVDAQNQNQTSPASSQLSQEGQQELVNLAEKFRELVTNAGANISLQQGGNLTENVQSLMNSPQFQNLSNQLSQQLTQLGIDQSVVQNLKQESDATVLDLVQKLQNATSRGGGGQ